MSYDPDGELVAAIANGDAAAVRILVGRHLPRITAAARRLLGSKEEAEDVAQEVFLRVWTHARAWQPGQAKFETWMHRVAINLCYDRLRRRREMTVEEFPEVIDTAISAEGGLERQDLSRTVEQALASLPERQRAAIVLCHYQEMSNIEAAQILEVSVEALESLLARGRRQLRELLKGERNKGGAG